MHIALFAAGLGLLTLSCDFALTINEILKWLSLLPIWNSECINHSGGDTVALGCCPPLLHQCTKSILICFLFGQTHFEVVSNFIYIYTVVTAKAVHWELRKVIVMITPIWLNKNKVCHLVLQNTPPVECLDTVSHCYCLHTLSYHFVCTRCGY